jgi:hypothetical protein
MNKIRAFLSHFLVAGSIMLLTFFVTDRFNPAMAFIDHPMTKWLLTAYCFLCVFLSLPFSVSFAKSKKFFLTWLFLFPIFFSLSLFVYLIADYFYPQRLYFSTDTVKFEILILALLGLALAIFSIVFFRRKAWERVKQSQNNREGRDFPHV